jgi:hypothetical protein
MQNDKLDIDQVEKEERESAFDYQLMGQVIDSTWGRSSTPRTASYSIKVNIVGPGLLSVSYGAVVNFGNEREMIIMKRTYSEEAKSIIKEVLKHIKSAYKEISSETITLKERNASDSLEIVNYNVHNPKRTAIFHQKCLVEVS